MEITMTLVYDGQKELMKAKGFKTVEDLAEGNFGKRPLYNQVQKCGHCYC